MGADDVPCYLPFLMPIQEAYCIVNNVGRGPHIWTLRVLNKNRHSSPKHHKRRYRNDDASKQRTPLVQHPHTIAGNEQAANENEGCKWWRKIIAIPL